MPDLARVWRAKHISVSGFAHDGKSMRHGISCASFRSRGHCSGSPGSVPLRRARHRRSRTLKRVRVPTALAAETIRAAYQQWRRRILAQAANLKRPAGYQGMLARPNGQELRAHRLAAIVVDGVNTGKFSRNFVLGRVKADADKRTIELSFSSEYPVNRGSYVEVLDHDRVDLSWLNSGAGALLFNHDRNAFLGAVQRAWVSPDKKGRALVRFASGQRAQEAWADVESGVLKNVSVSYEINKMERSGEDGGKPVMRCAWSPYEISLVTIPADPGVGIGRSRRQSKMNNEPNDNEQITEPNRAARRLQDRRREDILAAAGELGKQMPECRNKFMAMAQRAIVEGIEPQEFNRMLLDALPGARKTEFCEVSVGLDENDARRYSVTRAIRSMLPDSKDPKCFELDVSQQFSRKFGTQPEGIWIPPDVVLGVGRRNLLQSRDLNVTTASQGGNFVATILATPIIEILRNRMVTERLGIQVLSGLSGNVAIPRQTGAATAYSLAEAAILTKSTQAINQLSVTPHRVGAWNSYTKQLLLQSSVDVEGFIRDDLMKVLAIKLDKLTLEGSGAASEPTGVLNTPAIGAVTFGGAVTWAKAVSFETALATANADMGRMAYVTTPGTKAKWKTTLKVPSGTTPVYIWEEGNYGGETNDGKVNMYRAASTNQISSDYVAFGNWEEAVLAMWGGFDVVVDPYTNATSATVNVVVNSFVDVAVRHAASFAWSTDAGNQ